MTMTKGVSAKPPSPGARRTHVPGDGTAGAAAVERARKSMLDGSCTVRVASGTFRHGPAIIPGSASNKQS